MNNTELAKSNGAVAYNDGTRSSYSFTPGSLDALIEAARADERAKLGVPAIWMWEMKSSSSKGFYYEDPANFGIDINNGQYNWSMFYAAPQAPTPPAAMVEENQRLRQIVSDCVKALGTAAFAAPDCSLAFMESIPAEIEATVKHLRATPPAAMVPRVVTDENVDLACLDFRRGNSWSQSDASNLRRVLEAYEARKAAHGIGTQGAQEGAS